jgi:hypothetical protein
LDGLSHFHFTPRPVVSDGKITSLSLPSIMLEEATPAGSAGALSSTSQSAPEEVSLSSNEFIILNSNLSVVVLLFFAATCEKEREGRFA